MTRFLECARRGQRASGSMGEHSAMRLANQVRALSNLLSDIDDELREEFFALLQATSDPETRAETLKLLP